MLNINIDTNKLIDNDILFNNKEDQMDNSINYVKRQLKNNIKSGINGCFLISGYRGVGKTTIIDKLEEELRDEKHIFVKINVSKYEEHHFIIRKLIRELYEEYIKKEKFNLINLFGKKRKFKKQIELLYDRTFYEITEMNIRKKQYNADMKIEVKNIVQSIIKIVLAALALLITTKYDLSKNVSNKNILEMLIALWGGFEGANIISILKYNYIRSDEINRKSLYDNDIAEIRLKNTLKDLNSLGFKITIVLDELDKIEDEVNMNNILSELKPLLLSNLSNFIIISGQRLYYKIYNSKTVDDALISNIFSHNIHIPLAKKNDLYNLIDACICKSSDNDEKINREKEYYINSVILRSNTTVRLLKNIVLQDVKWVDGKSYIEISEYKKSKYKTDSKILEAINIIVENDIDRYKDDIVIKDFYTYQLYLWGKKVQLLGREQFKSEDVFNFDDEYGKGYPQNSKNKLKDLLKELLNTLSSEKINLMERENKGTEDEPEFFYKWLDDIKITEEPEIEYIANMRQSFIEYFIVLEKYCRNIYVNVDYKYYNNKSIHRKFVTIRDILLILLKNDILNNLQYENFMKYSKLRNSILHGESDNHSDIDEFKEANAYISNSINILIETHLYNECVSYFSDKKYTVLKGSEGNLNHGFDLEIVSENLEKQSIYILTKRIRRTSTKIYSKIISDLILKVKSTPGIEGKNDIKLILVYIDECTKDNKKNINKYVEEMELRENIFIFNIVDSSDFNIKKYLDDIVLKSYKDICDIEEVATYSEN